MLRVGLILLVVAAFVCGCSVRYAQRVPGLSPGYVDTRLGEDTWQVTIGEAWPRDWPDLAKFAIYRAAEKTQQSGRRYFSIRDTNTRTTSSTIETPGTSTTTVTASRVGSTVYADAVTRTLPGSSVTIEGGFYTLEYRILKDNAAPNNERVVDSEEVIRDLKYFIDRRR